MPRRRSSRRVVHSDASDEEEEAAVVEEEEEDKKPAAASSSSKNKRRMAAVMDSEDDDDEEGEEAGEAMFSSQIPELTQDIPTAKANERSNLLKLTEEKREKAISDLTRLVLFKALSQEPIDRAKCAKDAGITESKISSAAFEETKIRLKNMFDFDLKRIPTWMEVMKDLPSKFKDRYYVVNGIEDDVAGEHSKAIHAVHDSSSIEKGLLMVILSLTYCHGDPRHDGSRWILDKDLYSLLNKIDENIPSEPPAPGSKKKRTVSSQTTSSGRRFDGGSGVSQTPDIDVLLEQFEKRDYVMKLKANDQQIASLNNVDADSFFYTMGPRAAVEIGRTQIIYFCAELLEQEADPTMLAEVQEDASQEEDGMVE